MNKEFTIFINHEITSQNLSLFISQNEKPFYNELLDSFEKINIAGFVLESNHKFHDWDISKEDRIATTNLALFSKNSGLKRLLNYKYALFRMLPLILTKQTLYFYYYGNVSLLAAFLFLFFKKEYGVYLRSTPENLTGYKKWLSEFFLARASFVLCTGNQNKKYVEALGVRNVENVVPMMKVSSKDLWKRPSYAIENEVKILFFSRVEQDKGIFEAIEAVKSLIQAGTQVHLTIAGGGSPQDAERVKSAIEPIKQSVTLREQISDRQQIFTLFKECDIYLFPTYHEGFPRVLYEAMTFSTPIVTTNISATDGIMKERENCLKVAPKSVLGLYNALQILIDDEKLRETIGQNSYNNMEQFFRRIAGNSHAKQLANYLDKSLANE